jgi:glutaconyl-CoA/methylmalonyl-CoA decarboxylase subunit delta
MLENLTLMIGNLRLWLISSQSSDALNEIRFTPESIIDNNGLVVTVASYLIVFGSLFLLYLIFSWLTKFLMSNQIKRLTELGKPKVSKEELFISGEETAAIAAALSMYFDETHDLENTVLTITRVQKPYSPWSSKIYNIPPTPRVR